MDSRQKKVAVKKVATKKSILSEPALKENSALDKEISLSYLFKFSLPTILSMIIMGSFGIVDGVFVSRLIDPVAFSATSIAFPFLTFALAVGFMLGVGGNALAAKTLGEGNVKRARGIFSFICIAALLVSIVMTSIGLIFPNFVLNILGAGHLHAQVLEYLIPILWFMPIIMLSVVFQQFLMTEGKAYISTISFFVGGGISAGLNWLLIGQLGMGLQGASLATAIGYSISAIIGGVFFILNKKGKLYFDKPIFELKVLIKSSTNGLSEFVSMISIAIVSTIVNNLLIDMPAGELNVAAVGISYGLMGILASIFIGYSSGILPIIGFNYGQNNTARLKKIFSTSIKLVMALSIASLVLAWVLTGVLIRIYFTPETHGVLFDMSVQAFRVITAGFMFTGFNSFASMFFTGLQNGKVSALISASNSLIFPTILLFTLPTIMPSFNLAPYMGVYTAMPIAEGITIIVSITVFMLMKKRYQYA